MNSWIPCRVKTYSNCLAARWEKEWIKWRQLKKHLLIKCILYNCITYSCKYKSGIQAGTLSLKGPNFLALPLNTCTGQRVGWFPNYFKNWDRTSGSPRKEHHLQTITSGLRKSTNAEWCIVRTSEQGTLQTFTSFTWPIWMTSHA